MTAQIVAGDGIATGSLWHRTYHRATVRAIDRDLHRLIRVLPDRMDRSRRTVIVEHVDFLIDRANELHSAIDATIWPRMRRRRPDLHEMACQAALAHRRLAAAFHKVVVSAHWWGGDPGHAQNLIAELQQLSPLLETCAAVDDEFLAETSAMASTSEWSRMRRVGYDTLSPIRLAYRVCWQLDELDPVLAQPLMSGISRPAIWLLCSGFTGGYNHRAGQMWAGDKADLANRSFWSRARPR